MFTNRSLTKWCRLSIILSEPNSLDALWMLSADYILGSCMYLLFPQGHYFPSSLPGGEPLKGNSYQLLFQGKQLWQQWECPKLQIGVRLKQVCNSLGVANNKKQIPNRFLWTQNQMIGSKVEEGNRVKDHAKVPASSDWEDNCCVKTHRVFSQEPSRLECG